MRAAEFADDLGPQMQHRICNFPKRIDSSRGPGSVSWGQNILRRERKALVLSRLWTADSIQYVGLLR